MTGAAGTPQIFALLCVLIVAPVVGSWLGVLVRRLPQGRPTALARSACENCGGTLQARDLVPVVSYVVLRGRCRVCRAPIGPFHLAIELAAMAVAAWAALAISGDAPRFVASCALGWLLLAVAWIDAEHFTLPDVLTLPLLLGGLAATWALDPEAMADHAAAAILGYLTFRGVAAGYRRLRGRDGLGEGDAKLLAAAGAWVGLAALPLIVLASAVSGIALALFLRMRDGAVTSVTPIPFGPSIALALWLVWLYGQ